jgi:hypothetical protein
MQIAAFLLALLLAQPAGAQTCRVQCPDGSSVVADCDTDTDPCGGSSGISSNSDAPSADDGATGRAQEAVDAEAVRFAKEQSEAERRSNDAFNRDRDRSLNSLKGTGSGSSLKGVGSSDEGLKGLAEEARHEDLREAPAGAGTTKPKRKVRPTPTTKPWPHPRLHPVANPLRKDPLSGDSVGFLAKYANWAEANACTGTAALDGGKVVCCPKGFPYYCDGRCYKAAAFSDMRIPCDSALLTTQQKR